MTITPRFTSETEEVILQRILDDIVPEVDKRQGSIAYDLTNPVSQEFAQAYINLDLALSYAFLNSDMPSDLLTRAASDFGVDRKPAVKAEGNVELTGPANQVVPQGTQVRTNNGIYFVLKAQATLTGGKATATVQAVNGGTSGNVAIGAIDTIVGDLAGIVSVKNAAAFTSGVDEETDEALLARTYDKVRKPATSGNGYHYEQWAKEVAGVGDAKVFPVWDGPGTVKVVLLSDEKKTPVEGVINNAKTHIESERPIGATVTVVGASEVAINVTAKVTLSSGADVNNAKTQFESTLSEYLKSLAFTDNTVRYTKIASILSDVPIVVDYAELKVNTATANITTTEEQVAVLGTVQLSV